MNTFSKATQQYLQKYAAHEIQYANTIFEKSPYKKNKQFQYCLCIPVCSENAAIINHWLNLAMKNNALLIVVLNQPASKQSIQKSSEKNSIFSKAIRNLDNKQEKFKNCSLHQLSSTSGLFLVDRFTHGNRIPIDQGVGCARKIAADIALQLITDGYIASQYIHCSDADVSFPDNYFLAAKVNQTNESNISAILYPYSHQHQNDETANSELQIATKLYELHLEHYVNGLRDAGSMYAYHSLGSIMCVSAYHYAAVRGFPQRSAGEDFYLLNKLRKLGDIITLKKPILIITPRISKRTPFGTGAAVNNLIAKGNHYEAKIFYHPDLFILLKYGLMWLKNLADDCFTTDGKKFQSKQLEWRLHLKSFLQNIPYVDESNSKEMHSYKMLQHAFETLNFDKIFQHCQQQCKSNNEYSKQLNYWFDSFRTLKCLHLLREKDSTLNNISYRTLEKIHNR